VTNLDLERRVATAKLVNDCSYYTESTERTEVEYGTPVCRRPVSTPGLHRHANLR
jgi:hypothetical protein